MPNYDYKCDKCDEVFEVFQSMNDPRLEKCNKQNCDGKVKRLIGTGAGIIFKGSGFYSTDYRSENYKNSSKKEQENKSAKSSDSTKNNEATKKTSSSCSGGCACH